MSKKKTTKIFVQEVFDLVGSEYETLGVYVNAKTKIKMKHVECGYEYEVAPDSFLRGRRCPKCFGKFKKTTEIFKKEILDLAGPEYEFLGEYENNSTKVKIKHVECGHEWGITPNGFLSKNSRCPKCFGNMKKTTNEYKKEIFDLVGNAYEILGEYLNTETKIKMKHVECDHEWEATPHNFLRGTRCPKCCNSKAFSKGEFELGSIIKESYKGEILLNDRTIIPSMITNSFYELDIYLPEIKLAIEYNGKYWHEKRELEVPGYHDYKQKICDEKGIKLINVDDEDWKDEEKRKVIIEEITGRF